MKSILLLFTMSCALLTQAQLMPINAVLGDTSYFERFGIPPTETTNYKLRIKTHLTYVEGLLRSSDDSHLSKELKARRAHAIDLLHQYKVQGVCPSNFTSPTNAPCFIDADGRVCAVGYMIKHTIGTKELEAINEEHQLGYILEIDNAPIAEWAAQFGLTLEECAMIQPILEPVREEEQPKLKDIKPPPPVRNPNDAKLKDPIIEFPDIEPIFPGGQNGITKHIKTHLVYPETALEMNEQGRVLSTFVVELDGSISNVVIVRGVSASIDREAKRIVRLMPKWQPGVLEGEQVRTKVMLPIIFKLH